MHKGSCLCGAVTFEVAGDLPAPDACHCSMCRKQSGHFWASTDVAREALTLHGEDKLTWFQASEKVRRGFCSVCGSFLFWDPPARSRIAIAEEGVRTLPHFVECPFFQRRKVARVFRQVFHDFKHFLAQLGI